MCLCSVLLNALIVVAEMIIIVMRRGFKTEVTIAAKYFKCLEKNDINHIFAHVCHIELL